MTVMAAPPAMPCSASKLLVLTFTVSMVSAGETSIVWCGSQMFRLVAPSVFVPLLLRFIPFTFVDSARPGVSTSLFCILPGVAPGTRLISVW